MAIQPQLARDRPGTGRSIPAPLDTSLCQRPTRDSDQGSDRTYPRRPEFPASGERFPAGQGRRPASSDISLPAYVGAVPPVGVPEWDWQKTWDIQCRRLLTVSKKPEDGGHFRTITEALDYVQPGMTIRVLDDAVYGEYLLINRREQHYGVVLEAAGKATIRKLPRRWDKELSCPIPGLRSGRSRRR